MKFKKTRGFTLIELLVNISIGIIVLAITMEIQLSVLRIYKKSISDNLMLNQIEDTFINIDNIVKSSEVYKIEVLDNSLIVYTRNNSGVLVKDINFNKNYLRVNYQRYDETYGNYIGVRYNYIIIGIEDFKITTRGNLIFITIVKEGKEYKKCL